MKLYRYSPIKNESKLHQAIHYIHKECHKLCFASLGKYLPNAGNIGIFCHYHDEYEKLIQIRENITEVSDNVHQKYFHLHTPIEIPAHDEIPAPTYSYLSIRKPDPYRHHVGDLDFYLEEPAYEELKKHMKDDQIIPWARIFDRADLDMIELYNPDSDVLAYISTKMMTQKVRVKQ